MTPSADPASGDARNGSLLRAIRQPGEFPVLVELRPPLAGLGRDARIDAWIDLHDSIGRFVRDGHWILLTDDAVGEAEEENLGHSLANLPDDVPRDRIVPILTCKHSLEYCLLYGKRAAGAGIETLTVVGGDPGGPARCVPHAYLLRDRLRASVPGLTLAGWANPHRDPEEQFGFLEDDFHADLSLTQIVTDESVGHLASLASRIARSGLDLPLVAGIFHFHNADPRRLEMLGRFFPVPAERITREYDAGVEPEAFTARAVRAARDAGASAVYVSNVGLGRGARRLRRILELAGVSG
jgi:5,10-methylenetetrahydrofolate reductase